MGIYSDWIERNPEANNKQAVNVEFVLKMLDRVAFPFPVGAQYIQYPSTANNNIDLAFPIQKRPGSL
jgi:hypothetical protein